MSWFFVLLVIYLFYKSVTFWLYLRLQLYMKKISILLSLAIFMSCLTFVQASHPDILLDQPVVSNITSNSAYISVPDSVLKSLSQEQKDRIYFEYIPSQQVCIAIYPVPENCLPFKTIKGKTSVVIKNLKPSTSYNVYFKADNSIFCITVSCHENNIISATTDFKTKASTSFTRNLYYRSRGSDVSLLQDILRSKGYLNSLSTGYFGIATFKAVKAFQKEYMHIVPTGYVGTKTRLALLDINTQHEEKFEGTIQSVSTACFSDGECSVTIDGKKVVTTIGWSQEIVGTIKGSVNNIGDMQTTKIGTRAKVYAKKTLEEYTLYGNADYYIEVM
jgi:Putative peptidoglycan binding domain